MTKTYKYLIIVFFTSLCLGWLSEFMYIKSPQKAIDMEQFQSELKIKQELATKTLEKIKDILIHSSLDSVTHSAFPDNEITYYLFSENQLVFWSENHIDTENFYPTSEFDWEYSLLPNAHCIAKCIRVDNYYILALITIKYNYPYQNETLKNTFAKGFSTNDLIEIKHDDLLKENSIRNNNTDYLFTLVNPEVSIFSDFWGYLGLILHTFSFLILFFLYANIVQFTKRKHISVQFFLLIFSILTLILGLSLYFDQPSLIYWNKLFSPFQYASNPFLASISHLAIVSLFFLASNYIFYFNVKLSSKVQTYKAFILQFVFALHFILVYFIISGLITHSSIQISILKFNDISVISIFTHFLILLWGIGLTLLFYKTHNWLKKEHKIKEAILFDIIIIILIIVLSFIFSKEDVYRLSISYSALLVVYYLPYFSRKRRSVYIYLAGWVLVYVVFFIVNSLLINNEKTISKYHVLAENIMINGNTENDKMADILLEELDLQIFNDKNIQRINTLSDTIISINNYINDNYLRGFWNKYEMRLNVASPNSELQFQYENFFKSSGSKIKNTHFYSVPTSYRDMSYLGIFPIKNINNDSIWMYMEFYPRKNFKSYSFPNLLITSMPDIQTQLGIVVAKYEGQRLIYASGKSDFPKLQNWIPKRASSFYSVYYNNKIYYVYSPDKNNYIVISEIKPYHLSAYLLYFSYTFLISLLLCWFIIWSFNRVHVRTEYHIGLTAKFQYSFIILMIISFLGIFYVSVNFIQNKYKEEQILHITNKKSYIQNALQELYYWNQDLTNVNQQQLNFDLQELSYRYQTDIHVYDNRGELVGSSQPLIFNKNLISKQISPKPFFSKFSDINQDEHIGELKYLTGYTDFLNGDFLQIGYIAVPQFFSQEEIRSEIESFLAVVIHIYLIIIFIAIILSLFIGRQLSAPLKMIENKLKQMRFGHRNEKIEYQLNDEIGKLVAQYNRTVDELENSAKLLAQSERETAWKTMARQIAHEINNPLTPMKLTIQQLQRTKSLDKDKFDAYFEKSSAILIEQIDNLSRIAGTFSNFARMPEAQFERVDIAQKLFSTVELFANNNESININFKGNKNDLFIIADPEQLIQVFNNLMKNAIQSIPANEKGKIDVEIKHDSKRVTINFIDNGCGISEEVGLQIFNPNFTTKSTGMGLGLTITKNIIEITGGEISFTTNKDKGTRFTLSFPTED